MADSADEFAVIARHFAPLATQPGARGLQDDAAVLDLEPGALVVTADAIVEGVHFLPDDPIEAIARKALRVNLSDLAAKGARPLGYLLTLAWPRMRPAAQIAAFAQGLRADQELYGLSLWGGDTVATPGPLTVAITAFGRPIVNAPPRSGARPGDVLLVSGTIGDGHLGLRVAQGRLDALDRADREALIDRYRLPQPRLALAEATSRFARAAMDVSDGLFADAAKMAAASAVALVIEPDCVPVSAAAARWLEAGGDRETLCAGGDDYELLVAVAPPALASIEAAAGAVGVALTRIGRVEDGDGLWLLDARGRRRAERLGFAHALGA